MSLENGRLKRLTQDGAIDVSPSWSPDGQKIAFVSNRAGSPQIYIMNHEGGNVRRLTYDGGYNTSPAWSPKGDKIAYEKRVSGSFQIYTIREDGSDSTPLTPCVPTSTPIHKSRFMPCLPIRTSAGWTPDRPPPATIRLPVPECVQPASEPAPTPQRSP